MSDSNDSSILDPNKEGYVLVDTPGKVRTLKALKYFIVALLIALSTYAFIYELKGVERVKGMLGLGNMKEAKGKSKPTQKQRSKKNKKDAMDDEEEDV